MARKWAREPKSAVSAARSGRGAASPAAAPPGTRAGAPVQAVTPDDSPPSRSRIASPALRLFQRVLDLGPAEREACLDREIGHDEALRAEVDALLDADARPGAFLVRPIADPPALDSELPHDEAGESSVGTRVGPYVIVGRLGEGEHAEVFEAVREDAPDERVALKILRPGAGRREVVRRFEAERRIIAALDHPGIARLLDSGTTGDGRAYFVMERIEGEAITAFCEGAGLDVRERVRLLVGVCGAVEHAHQRGVIHRDLKPSNVLAFGGSAGAGAKVIDFGIAKALAEGLREQSTLTTQGRILGTIPYMAPERFGPRGHEADTRADVYALGAVLHEMLAGRPALDLRGLDPAAAVRRIVEDAPVRLGTLNPRCRGDLETVVAKAMAKEPGRRYASVAEFREDLERWEAGRPIEARPPSAAYLARRWVGRHRVAAAAGVAGGLVVAGALGAAAVAHRERVWALEREAAIADAAHDLAVRMAKRADLRSLRRDVLDPYLQTLEASLARDPGNPVLMDRVADMLGFVGAAELDEGLTQEARARFERVLAIREKLSRRFARSSEAAMDLSIAIVRVGDADKQRGDYAAAGAKYRRAFEMDTRAAASRPHDPRALTLLVWSHDRLGWEALHGHIGGFERHTAALRHFTQMRELAQRLRAVEKSADAERALSVACMNLATVADRIGMATEFGGLSITGIEHAFAALGIDPDDRAAFRHLAGVMASDPWVESAGAERLPLKDNLRLDADPIAVARRLVQAEPRDISARWTLVLALCWVSLRLEQAGRLHEALHLAQEAAREAAVLRDQSTHSMEVQVMYDAASQNLERLRGRVSP